jgi:hypothetical protein
LQFSSRPTGPTANLIVFGDPLVNAADVTVGVRGLATEVCSRMKWDSWHQPGLVLQRHGGSN